MNWIKHKDANPWVLTCVTFALSKMGRSDWYSTSVDTNIAESAHAQLQRDGVKLTRLPISSSAVLKHNSNP